MADRAGQVARKFIQHLARRVPSLSSNSVLNTSSNPDNGNGNGHGNDVGDKNGRGIRPAGAAVLGRPTAALDRWSGSLADMAHLVLAGKSPEQKKIVISEFIRELQAQGDAVPDVTTTPYLNTIPVDEQPEYPGDLEMERLIRAHVRWNAMAMVVKANKSTNVGGHIATFASLATLYDAEKKEVASYSRGANTPPSFDAIRRLNGVFDQSGFLHIVRSIQRDDETAGYIYIRVVCDRLWERLSEQIRLAVILLCVSLIGSIALAGSLQRGISTPILQLVETTHRIIKSGDYSLRARKFYNDELGTLAGAFNDMLATIESRDRELTDHRENLTELVTIRTAELERKTEEAMAASVAFSGSSRSSIQASRDRP